MGVTVEISQDENFAANMLHYWKKMMEYKDRCDFIIEVDGDEYPTHKNILSANSDFFYIMFKHKTKESRDGRVKMKHVDSECVKTCIDFMYYGKFCISYGKIAELLHVAVMLQLKEIEIAISNVLIKSLNVENFHETKNLADLYNLENLSILCNKFLEKNRKKIRNCNARDNKPKSKIGKSDNFPCSNPKILKIDEDEEFCAALQWARNDPEKYEELMEFVEIVSLLNP